MKVKHAATRRTIFLAASLFALNAVNAQNTQLGAVKDWDVYLGDKSSSHYSKLKQITKENVSDLEVVWTYRTGHSEERGDVQTNPLIIDGVLYGATTWKNVFAIDAATGEELWRFDPRDTDPEDVTSEDLTRGRTYWRDSGDQRLFFSAALPSSRS